MHTFAKFSCLVGLLFAVGCASNVSPTTLPTESIPPVVTLAPTVTPGAVAPTNGLTTTVTQNGVTLQVTLPRTSYWASEVAEAEVRLENNGTETFAYSPTGYQFVAAILNVRGESMPQSLIYGMSRFGGTRVQTKLLKPGDSYNQTLRFQVPTIPDAKEYSLWVTTRLRVPDTAPKRLRGTLALKLDAGPVALSVLAPDTAHQLFLHMQANKDGYTLTATDGLGNPAHQVQGILQIGTPRGVETRGIDFDANGRVRTFWQKQTGYAAGSRIEVWVWADNLAANGLAFATPGEVTSTSEWLKDKPDARASFATLRAAQSGLNLELYTLEYRPAGMQLEAVLGQSDADDGGQRFAVDAYYHLQNGGILKFSQSGYKKNGSYVSNQSGGPSSEDATAIQIGTASGYQTVEFERMQLEWQRDGVNFRLSAPRAALTQAELVQIAEGIAPLF